MGTRKINIKKINNKNYLKATFSKRRRGLFSKATDLCCLSGAQIAIITFSPGNKTFLFGNPSAKAVLDRFLGEQDSCTSDDHHEESLGSTPEDSDHEDLEASRKESSEIEDVMDEDRVNFWWDDPIDDELGIYELRSYKGLLEALKENVASKLDDMNRREFSTKDFLSMFRNS
ncbi:PREDICTED: agamous-like MADS-box protein AGL62 [Prunus mume]|uniref:Agamous-like MADS-box protein AGL62 n=1 Tax=Prunus mume TaxID=102107 RepID=A0ABM0NQB3_PRUMU|nr:PREDICTED: agamous-like MADS-box protein AGL62 [Prunus mume]